MQFHASKCARKPCLLDLCGTFDNEHIRRCDMPQHTGKLGAEGSLVEVSRAAVKLPFVIIGFSTLKACSKHCNLMGKCGRQLQQVTSKCQGLLVELVR